MPAPIVTTMLLSAIALAASGVGGTYIGILVIAAVLLQVVVTAAEAFSGPTDDLDPL